MKRKLTFRQQQFLLKFLEISREIGKPVHYLTVAEEMKVGKVTAYEMLRLLEEHGYVHAEYFPNPDQHGPGRSVVLFSPTEAGLRLRDEITGRMVEDTEFEKIKTKLIKELKEDDPEDREKLLEELVSHIPEIKSPLTYAAGLITSIVIYLTSFKDNPTVKAILDRLCRIGLPHEISLNVISGITMVISVWDTTNRKSTKFLMSQIERFENVVSQLNDESRKKLGEFTREITRILSG